MPATNELLQEGRYRICQPTDGSGNVFEAYDTVRNTNVIVREIHVRLDKVNSSAQRESLELAFANQAKALTEIEHDALLQVRDFFSEIDRRYLVTDSLEGDDLRQLIKKNKQPFPVSQVTAWADELLDALNYLHTRRPPIVHLDIRPENLKLSSSGRIKLVGFSLDGGIASETSPELDEADLRYSPMEKIWPGLDAASQKVITNSYDDRSERILKEPADARSDIYSLGATLYFLITGTEPIDTLERSIEMLEGKLDPLREPSTVNASIPSEISDVLMKALEIKRENRYDSALIMRQVLQTALERVAERERTQVPAEAAVEIPLKEKTYNATAARSEAAVGNDLLEIPNTDVAAHSANAVTVDEEELAAVLQELEKAEAEAGPGFTIKSEPDAQSDGVGASVESLERMASEEATDTETQTVDDIFTTEVKPGSSMRVPALAAAAAVVVLIAIGGWFAFSGSPEAPKPQLVAQPAPVKETVPLPNFEPTADAGVTAPTELTAVSSANPSETATEPAAPKTVSPAKPKKAEKPTEAKKKVTVDDLINDN